MDRHKITLHPKRVSEWLRGDMIYPLEAQVCLSGTCNHKCVFCAMGSAERKPCLLTRKVMEPNLKIMGEKGVKSVIYAGEGEPFVNPEAADIINITKSDGMDTAVSTNGVLLTKEKSAACLKSLSWVRFTIAGASDETYEKIHRCKKGDFQKALQNMTDAAKIKRQQKLNVTLMAQMSLLPENKHEVTSLAKIIRAIGFDCFTVKYFSADKSGKGELCIDNSEAAEIGRELREYGTENFKVYFRARSADNLGTEKPYNACRGIYFKTNITASGNVCPCGAFTDGDRVYGNINEKNFADIWESKYAEEIRRRFDDNFIHKNCGKNCRLDEINEYLHQLKNPTPETMFL